MKKRFSFILILLLIMTVLAGCSSFKQRLDHGKKTEKNKDMANKENTVVWAVREDAGVPEKNSKKTNQLLAKKGYGLAVKVKKLKTDRPMRSRKFIMMHWKKQLSPVRTIFFRMKFIMIFLKR